MTVDLRSKSDAHVPTVILYCPYDRKTTRHIRRESDGAIVCAECGRGVDLGDRPTPRPAAQRRSHQPSGIAPRATIHRGRHVADLRGDLRRGLHRWQLVILGAFVLALAALIVAINLAGLGSQVSPTGPASLVEGAIPAVERPVLVTNTGGIGAYLRRTPQLEDKLRAWPDGTVLKTLGPSVMVDGIEWSRVRDPSGTEGWIPTQYTRATDRI